MNSSHIFRCIIILIATINSSRAGDWMTWRSTYTHDPLRGQRVDQYAPAVDPIAPDQGNLVRSGYRHYRSTIQAGESADNLHIVNEWGRPVMPYEHWRFPYRPFGAPYQAWGPPVPNVLSNFNYGFPNVGSPYGPGGHGAHGGHSAGGVAGASGGYPGTGYPSGGYLGGGYPSTGHPGGQAGLPPGSPVFPLVPPYQPAPWYDGMYPNAAPLDNQSDERFFFRPPSPSTPSTP